MRRIISIALIALAVVGCGQRQQQEQEQMLITGVVLPRSSAHFLPDSRDGKPIGAWTPSQAAIKLAEPAILEYIKESDQDIFENLDQYRCQYFGIIVAGKKRIYCNFFWFTEESQDWRTRPIFALDGGSWYFQLEYDVETGQCLNFAVNGES